MKERIQITIDVSKIDKSRITEKRYMKDGKEVVEKLLKLEVIPLKNERFVTEGDTWKLIKTHFVATAQTKEERANKVRGTILGDGIVLRNKVDQGVDYGTPQPTVLRKPAGYPEEEINPDNIPF